MDNNKPSESSSTSDPTTTISGTTDNVPDRENNNHPLRHLHRFSHKISKPSRTSFDSLPLHHHLHHQQNQNLNNQNQQQQQQSNNQPPVYNINKNDFRDVVQKLTGAPPALDRVSPPPPPPPPPPPTLIQPPSSRLQRIRPPPLSQISNRPPPLPFSGGDNGPVFPTPSSPLPPLPSCHAAAESPITAYMRFLHGSGESNSGFSSTGLLNSSPKYNDLAAVSGEPQQLVPFGCFPSPRSPGTLFSPTGSGQFVFPQPPVSPRVPTVPSPK